MMAVGLELGERLLERDPPDVEGATRFAADFVLGGLGRAGVSSAAKSRSTRQRARDLELACAVGESARRPAARRAAAP